MDEKLIQSPIYAILLLLWLICRMVWHPDGISAFLCSNLSHFSFNWISNRPTVLHNSLLYCFTFFKIIRYEYALRIPKNNDHNFPSGQYGLWHTFTYHCPLFWLLFTSGGSKFYPQSWVNAKTPADCDSTLHWNSLLCAFLGQ